MHLSSVISRSEFFVHAERQSSVDGFCSGEFSVTAGTDAGACDDADFEVVSGVVFSACFFCQCGGDDFGRAGRPETSHSQEVAVLNHLRGVRRCNFRNNHANRGAVYGFMFRKSFVIRAMKPREVLVFLPSDKNNLFLQAHKKYAVFFLLLCTPRGRFQAQRACFSLFKADFRGVL